MPYKTIQLDTGTANTLKFDSTTLVIDESANRVGIGTSSPEYPFHISNTGGNCNVLLTSSNTGEAGIYFGDVAGSSQGRVYYDHNDDSLNWRTDTAIRMHLDNTGLGIGTTSPGYKLHVEGPIVGGLTADSGSHISIRRNGAIVGGMNTQAGVFNFFAGTTTSTQHMTIRSTGNVGIGTDSPTKKFHVAGTVMFSSLPTSDPSVAGELWNNSGTVKISAG